MWKGELGSTHLGQSGSDGGICEHGNEHSVCKKCLEFWASEQKTAMNLSF
jgi:hypothetical protein